MASTAMRMDVSLGDMSQSDPKSVINASCRAGQAGTGSVIGRGNVHHLAATVIAVDTQMMTPMQLPGGRIAGKRRPLQGIVRAALVALGARCTILLYGHRSRNLRQRRVIVTLYTSSGRALAPRRACRHRRESPLEIGRAHV